MTNPTYYWQNYLHWQNLATEYLANNNPRKLHLGCGNNILSHWLNSDFSPENKNIFHLDATRPFPFPDQSFNYVFSEHMIEHITYQDGLAMLKECYRILCKNGKIRISTPDLKFLVELYSEPKTDLQLRYIKWASASFTPDGVSSDTIVINNFVRNWGHLFIYDEKTLRYALNESGFVDVVRLNINESNDLNLTNLENEKRMPEGFLQLESMTLEARRP